MTLSKFENYKPLGGYICPPIVIAYPECGPSENYAYPPEL